MSGTRKSRATQNREQNRERSLANLRPFKPGQSGNPGGRPKGITAATRERIEARGGPEMIVNALLDQLDRPNIKPMEVVAIARELADRGWGKAPAFAAMEGGDPLELTETQEFMGRILDELAERREARAPGSVTGSDAASG